MIGLIDIDSKIPNLALMKISSFYKSMGEKIQLYPIQNYYRKIPNNQIYKIADKINKDCSKIYASAIFTHSQPTISILKEICNEKLIVGGTGSFTPKSKLILPIEIMKPDYNLYTVDEIAKRITGIGTKNHKLKKAKEIVNAGHGFTSRGCIRNCPFCMVPKCEGEFRQAAEISDLLNPKSNILILHDNNLSADPDCVVKLREIRDRKLIVDINQGIDIRLLNEDIARELSLVKHLRSIHYAWDLMDYESQVIRGISILTKYIKPYRHMCFMLVGFNTSYEEDEYRMQKLINFGIAPYVMIYNNNEKGDIRLRHFARWVNSRIYKICSFNDYEPWKKAQKRGYEQLSLIF